LECYIYIKETKIEIMTSEEDRNNIIAAFWKLSDALKEDFEQFSKCMDNEIPKNIEQIRNEIDEKLGKIKKMKF